MSDHWIEDLDKHQARDTQPGEWRVYTYDVWGNEEDGYEVNDKHGHGHHTMAWDHTDDDVLDAFGLGNGHVEDEGEIITVYHNGKPYGELVWEGLC